MARIDRRVSPNQSALWSVYELISIQARRVVTAASAYSRTRDSVVVDFGRSLLAAAARASRPVIRRVRALAVVTSINGPVLVP